MMANSMLNQFNYAQSSHSSRNRLHTDHQQMQSSQEEELKSELGQEAGAMAQILTNRDEFNLMM